MRFVTRSLAVAAIVALLGSTTAVAQSKISLGLVGGLYSLGGDDFEGVDAGFHFEGTVRYMASPQFSINVGGGYNVNSTEAADINFNVFRILAQPRYMFRMANPSFTPWVGGQVEWHSYSTEADFGAGPEDVSANGFGFGGLAGFTYWASPTLGIEGSVAFLSVQFGDADVGGQTVSGSDASGTALGVQLGVVIKLGGGGGGGM
jgi:hypothetical protein